MSRSDKLIEQVLLLRCQIGDRKAFADLIERYERPLRYFIGGLLGNPEMVEDIFQETWLTVIRRISGLRNTDAFPTWLYRIARNKVYQQLRKTQQLSKLSESVAVVNLVDDEVVTPEDAARVHQCLKALRPEHREVLMLRFLEQMSYQHIAEVLKCSSGTVKSRLHYAKLALKKEMEK